MKRTALVALALLAFAAACTNNKTSGATEKQQDTPDKKAATTASPKKAEATKKAEPKSLPAPKDVAEAPADAGKSKSGLKWKVLTPGKEGDKPLAVDRVKVHYTGWDTSGKMFDSSVVRGNPTTFGLNQVIKGWTEGLQLMTVGEKRRFWIPGALAYGDKPSRPGAPSGQLTFDVELLEIIKAPTPPETPKNVAKAPASATKTASGLKYIVLEKGAGTKPTLKDRVSVHYSGWTKDGKMFDSSIMRGRPATFGVTGVIKGWTEGLQLMAPGAKYRFWIPGDLAYGEKARRPGAPSGQLTFDVELIKVN